MPRPQLHIGTSGWNYDGWKGRFYPEDISQQDLLPCYAGHFDTVELNNSFYQLPAHGSIRAWLDKTPRDFRFACKASRYITHMKKLKDPDKSTPKFFRAMQTFEDKLGPILFQLPPNWRVNRERLAAFIDALPTDYRYTFELRDRSWLCDEIYQLLEERGAALCFYDFKGFRSPEVVTADFIYIRLHGPHETPYEGAYDGRTLAGYARKIRGWLNQGRDVYCYFDNDQKSCAPFDAGRLLDQVRNR